MHFCVYFIYNGLKAAKAKKKKLRFDRKLFTNFCYRNLVLSTIPSITEVFLYFKKYPVDSVAYCLFYYKLPAV